MTLTKEQAERMFYRLSKNYFKQKKTIAAHELHELKMRAAMRYLMCDMCTYCREAIPDKPCVRGCMTLRIAREVLDETVE